MNDDIDIRTLIGPIRRQSKLILTITLLFIAVSAIVIFTLTPKFQATALIYVDTGNSSLLDEKVNFSSGSSDHARIVSEVEIIKSDDVMLSLIEKMDLVSDDEFGVKLSRIDKIMTAIGLPEFKFSSGTKTLASVITNFHKEINVQRKDLSYIISVAVTSKSPQKAAKLANELSKSYIEVQLRSKISNIETSLNAVQRQVNENEANVVTTQKVLDEFIANNLDRIIKTNSQEDLIELQANLAGLRQQKLLANIQKSWVLNGLDDGELVSEFSGLKSKVLKELEIQRDEIARRISQEPIGSLSLAEFGSQMSAIEDDIKNESTQILQGINQTILEVDGSISEFQTQLNDRILSGGIELPDDLSAQLYRLSQQSRNTNTQYQRLLVKAQDLEAETLLQIADSRIISSALAPDEPVSPNLLLLISAAGVIALGFALTVAFVIENYIGGFTSASQLEEMTGLPLASSIRSLPANNSKSISKFVLDEPLSSFSAGIRKLRTSMLIALQTQRAKNVNPDRASKVGKVVMVSSALPEEGKSSISLSLARTLSSSGSKTIIIDCDLLKPSIASHLEIPEGKDLTDLFQSNITSENVADNIVVDHLTNLHAILGFKYEFINVHALLTFQPFESIIETVKQDYDFVILDTPPTGPVPDALALAGYSDVILFVVRWAKTSQRVVLESLKRIEAIAPDTPTLTVLSQVGANEDKTYAQYSNYNSGG